jgi:NAD(P)-dependent dehydrogenase (short-subunit alcohol dehydrogenase family)
MTDQEKVWFVTGAARGMGVDIAQAATCCEVRRPSQVAVPVASARTAGSALMMLIRSGSPAEWQDQSGMIWHCPRSIATQRI